MLLYEINIKHYNLYLLSTQLQYCKYKLLSLTFYHIIVLYPLCINDRSSKYFITIYKNKNDVVSSYIVMNKSGTLAKNLILMFEF